MSYAAFSKTVDQEEKLTNQLDLLHRVFADHAEQDVDLTKLTTEDFGVSEDLLKIASGVVKQYGIRIISHEPLARIGQAQCALFM